MNVYKRRRGDGVSKEASVPKQQTQEQRSIQRLETFEDIMRNSRRDGLDTKYMRYILPARPPCHIQLALKPVKKNAAARANFFDL